MLRREFLKLIPGGIAALLGAQRAGDVLPQWDCPPVQRDPGNPIPRGRVYGTVRCGGFIREGDLVFMDPRGECVLPHDRVVRWPPTNQEPIGGAIADSVPDGEFHRVEVRLG